MHPSFTPAPKDFSVLAFYSTLCSTFQSYDAANIGHRFFRRRVTSCNIPKPFDVYLDQHYRCCCTFFRSEWLILKHLSIAAVELHNGSCSSWYFLYELLRLVRAQKLMLWLSALLFRCVQKYPYHCRCYSLIWKGLKGIHTTFKLNWTAIYMSVMAFFQRLSRKHPSAFTSPQLMRSWSAIKILYSWRRLYGASIKIRST